MKFRSRKDILFSIIILGTCIFVSGMTFIGILKGEMQGAEYWFFPIIVLSIGLLLWIYFGTNYELSEEGFIYRSGPINGKISIHRISEIINGKTSWIGLRPATAQKGLIIKYDEYNEIYISPKTNEAFIEKILEFKPDILISE